MAYLLDTHTLIWMIEGNANLAVGVKNILDDAAETRYVSAVSFWEIAIKVSIGKLRVRRDIHTLPALLSTTGFNLLAISEHHALAVANLPFLHNDPFDRLLIAQANLENLTLLTKDPNIVKYNVPTFW